MHTISLPLRLWLFSLVYLGAARLALVSVHRQLMSCTALSTPTLIVGAGVVGDRLVKRLQSDPRYGLRPVGFIDADPVCTMRVQRSPVFWSSARSTIWSRCLPARARAT